MEFPLKSAVAAIALASATPAFALDVFSPCDPTRPTVDATACAAENAEACPLSSHMIRSPRSAAASPVTNYLISRN